MARKERNDIDYFPHSVHHGKKMFYMRSKFGNDGYAVWFMLLENLGRASYHYLDLSNEVELMYLSSEMKVPDVVLKEIINVLVKLGEFDKELWINESILFNQSFIENIEDAYRKRSNSCIDKNSLLRLLESKGRIIQPKLRRKQPKGRSEGDGNPQSKVNYTKVKYIKEKGIDFVFKSEDIFIEWDLYKKFRQEKDKFKFASKASEERKFTELMNLAEDDEDMAISIIRQSVDNGWKGLFKMKKTDSLKSNGVGPNFKFQ